MRKAFVASSDSDPQSRSTHHEIQGLSEAPSDPFLILQWNIEAVNVADIWPEYTGAGIRVGLNDQGIHYDHEDLASNYDARSDFDFNEFDNDPHPQNLSEYHGTFVGGIIAAAANGLGIVGIANEATLVSHRGLAFHAKYDVDISNNSWGFIQPFADISFLSDFDNLDTAVRTGRKGLGMVVVTSGGNARQNGDSANYDLFANSRKTITVAALNEDLKVADFSEPGANLLVTAPGEDIASTYPGDGYAIGSGTSFSAPAVSAVVALMLEANPLLGYRDVQEILALSAKQVDASDSGWSFNAAQNWNGGGLHFNNDHGYGLVDAAGAVRLAEFWRDKSTAVNELQSSYTETADVTLPDNATVTRSFKFNAGLSIDAVELDIALQHPDISNLVIRLISPQGTTSVLLDRPGLVPGSIDTVAFTQRDLNFTLTSQQFIGESSNGTWQLQIADAGGLNGTGQLLGFTARAYGDGGSANNTYYYTDALSDAVASDGAERLQLADFGGWDIINAAQVTDPVKIDLRPDQTSIIDGETITYQPGTLIENAVGGDGNDTLRGYYTDNQLRGGRGDDEINAGKGNDILIGGDGADTLIGGLGDDIYVVTDGDDTITEWANGGYDTLLTTQSLQLPNHVEAAKARDDQAIQLIGNNLDNLLTAGRNGVSFDGGSGDDTLIGGAGSDHFIGNRGDDQIEGGGGRDRASYDGLLDDYGLSYRDNVLHVLDYSGSGYGRDRLISVEQILFDDVQLVLQSDGFYQIEDLFSA